MIPHLSAKELEKFSSFLTPNCSYLEYGCGGSTVHASKSVAHVISIDSDPAWVEQVKEHVTCPHVIEHVDIGRVGNWGYPVDTSGVNSYYKYITQPWTIAKEKNITPTVIFIDGRFRVACALYSVLQANLNTKLLVHDYFDRPQYHTIEKFCTLIDKEETVAVFNITNKFYIENLVFDLLKHSARAQ